MSPPHTPGAAPPPPRYEFRIFEPATRADRGAPNGPGAETSVDVYLLGRPTRFSVKIRDNTVEVKERLSEAGSVQLWAPLGQFELPLEDRDALVAVFEHAGLETPAHVPRPVTQADLVDAVAAAGGAVEHVRKARTLFSVEGAQGEDTMVRACERDFRSLAVEHEDADTTLRAARSLGVADARNESYDDFLRRCRRESRA